jgi:hypothetical protein
VRKTVLLALPCLCCFAMAKIPTHPGITQGAITDEDRMFCAEQINVPPELPDILKNFTKAMIRANPSAGEVDPQAARMKIYTWSRDYFKAKLSNDRKGGS